MKFLQNIRSKSRNALAHSPVALLLSLLLMGSTILAMNGLPGDGRHDQIIDLHTAAIFGTVQNATALLNAGIPVDATNTLGWTPLMHAAVRNREEVAQLLIDWNAQINAKDNGNNNTPLRLAAQSGNKKICQLLLNHHAEVDTKDNRNETPLASAAKRGHKGICQLLIQHNAQIDAKNNAGKTPLAHAASWSNRQICQLLIRVTTRKIRQNTHAIITFLGCNRKRSANLLCQLPYDVAKIIARQLHEPAAQEKQSLFAQIYAIPKKRMQTELRKYAWQQLQRPSKNNSEKHIHSNHKKARKK